jgi:hypothetical protein
MEKKNGRALGYYPGMSSGTEENHEKPLLGQSASWPSLEPPKTNQKRRSE